MKSTYAQSIIMGTIMIGLISCSLDLVAFDQVHIARKQKEQEFKEFLERMHTIVKKPIHGFRKYARALYLWWTKPTLTPQEKKDARIAAAILGVSLIVVASTLFVLGIKGYRKLRQLAEKRNPQKKTKDKLALLALNSLTGSDDNYKQIYEATIQSLKQDKRIKNKWFFFPQGSYYFIQKMAVNSKKLSQYIEHPDINTLKGLVQEYKVHLMNKAEDTEKIIVALANDQTIQQNVYTIKFKNNRKWDGSRDYPWIVLYITGKANAETVINHLCSLLKDFQGDGNTLTCNQPINDLIFVAQGNRDDKISAFADYFTDDWVYYSQDLNEKGGNPNFKISASCN